jgi:hypothetical protein
MLLECFWVNFIQSLWAIFYLAMIVICLILIANHAFSYPAPIHHHGRYARQPYCPHNDLFFDYGRGNRVIIDRRDDRSHIHGRDDRSRVHGRDDREHFPGRRF